MPEFSFVVSHFVTNTNSFNKTNLGTEASKMGTRKTTRETDTTETGTGTGTKHKRDMSATPAEIGKKMKGFINKEKTNLQGSWKKIVRMVTEGKEETYTPRALIGRQAPDFTATAVFTDEFKEITLSQYAGKYVLLFFYPLDFTFVCPTELHAFQNAMTEFKKRGVEVLGCSVDSQFSHLNWLKTSKNNGGIEGVTYGLISDLGGHIANTYGVLNDEGVAYRALFLMDQNGVVRHQLINDLPLGRSVEEAIRMVDALQHHEKNGEVCPANWHKGEKAIQTTQESVAEYLTDNVQ